MNKIDTEYASLAEVDANLQRFYSEDVRTRTTGYTEPDEEGNNEAITETYTVVVLNKPDEVTYDYVESRRGRRFPEDVVKSYIPQAIEWEDFAVNHDGYNQWVIDHAEWLGKEPEVYGYEDEFEYELARRNWTEFEPVRPVVDIANQRAVYEQVLQSFDSTLFTSTESATEYDDTVFITTLVPLLVNKPDEEVIAYHTIQAKALREEVIEADIGYNGVMYQVGVFDLRNIQDAIYEAEHEGYPADHTQTWIAADNSLHELTVDDLKAIRSLKAKRKQETYEAYTSWRLGDKLTPFVL